MQTIGKNMSATIKFSSSPASGSHTLKSLISQISSVQMAIQAGNGHYPWQKNLLEEYISALAAAIGSVRGRGGYARIHFELGTKDTYWKNLSPATVKLYAQWRGIDVKGMSTDDAYDAYADNFTIWQDTGKLVGSLTVSKTFAGITSGSNAALANLLEHGGNVAELDESDVVGTGEIPARPLFTAANELFLDQIKKALYDKNSNLYKFIVADILSLVRKAGLWGDTAVAGDEDYVDVYSTKNRVSFDRMHGWGTSEEED